MEIEFSEYYQSSTLDKLVINTTILTREEFTMKTFFVEVLKYLKTMFAVKVLHVFYREYMEALRGSPESFS